MSQRGYLVLHAATAQKNNLCVSFSGKSHSGKSTIAYGLKKFGWKIISEDITVIDIDKMSVLPSFPYIKLSDEAKTEFFKEDLDQLPQSSNPRKGYLMKSNNSQEHEPEKICFLKWGEGLNIFELNAQDTLKNLFKFSFISGSLSDSKKLMKLANKCNFYSLEYPKQFSSIKKISDRLENF